MDTYTMNLDEIEEKDRQFLVNLISDYLIDRYGEINSFSVLITGEYDKSKYEYKGKRTLQ